MSEEHGKDRGKGDDDSPYIIDETVELEDYDNRQGYVWDIEEDIDPSSEYVLRGISRDEGTSVKFLVLPDEEAEAFQNGDNYWPEWDISGRDKTSATIRVNTEDEDPYYHSGDLKLAVERTSGGGNRVTVKFREANEE